MFVLASMMLLVVIGVSAIAAAGLNAGAAAVQRDRTQLEMYASSLERTINTALAVQESPNTMLSDARTLSGRILREAIWNGNIFPASATDPVVPGQRLIPVDVLFNITATSMAMPPAVIDAVYTIHVTGNLLINIDIYQRFDNESFFAGYDPITGDPIFVDTPATPMVILVSGFMDDLIVEVITTYEPIGGIRPGMAPMTLSTSTTYRLENSIVLIEDDIYFSFNPGKQSEPQFTDMKIDSEIIWTVIKHDSSGS